MGPHPAPRRLLPLSAAVRYAARSLAKAPLFTAVAMLSLGLALALNTTMFALVDTVAHPAMPYPEPDRIVTAYFLGGFDRERPVPLEDRYRAVREGATMAETVAGYTLLRGMVQAGTLAENQIVIGTTPELFTLLGVRAQYGRVLSSNDVHGQTGSAAVISFRLWRRFFNSRPLDRGLTLNVGQATYTVVGVMPRAVHFPFETDIWVPIASVTTDSTVKKIGPFAVLRLKRGVTIDMARTELSVVAARLSGAFAQRQPLAPKINQLHATTSMMYIPSLFGPTVFMVLIIACANLGTMMLARGMARRRETAIRVALGAGRRDVVGQVLAECGLVIAGGVAVGVLLTLWTLYILPHVVIPFVPALGDLDPVPSWRVFAFVLTAAMAMLIASGLLPALRAATTDPSEPMKEGTGTSTGRVRDRYNPLIVVEVALSTALLMTTALFLIIVVRLAIFDFQYAGERLVDASMDVNGRQAPSDAAVERLYDDLVVRSRQMPGVREAATTRWEYPDGPMVYVEQGKSGEQWMNMRQYRVVSAGFLRTLGIPVIQGRDFAPGDRGSGSGVVIVDEEAARRLWPDMPSPVGRMIKMGNPKSRRPWLRVVGVSRSTDLQPKLDASLPPEPSIYVLYPRDVTRQRELIVQGDGAGGDKGRAALALALQRDIQAIAPAIAPPRVRPWLEGYESTKSYSLFMASLFGAFSIFGLALCAVGLYGVLAYAVSRRLREFAVRVALGARRRDVARIVLHDAAVTALAGVGLGAFIALWQTAGMIDLMISMRFAHVLALAGAEVVLLLVALAACLAPVRRATRADPVEILRSA